MATIVDGWNALLDRLKAMPGRPEIHYLDDPRSNVLPPRLVVQRPSPQQTTMDLSGATDAFPEFVVRIETEEGDFGAAASAIVASIQDHFKAGKRFGGVTMLETPTPATSYSEGGIFHVPMVIRGRFFF